MTHEEFESLCSLIGEKKALTKQINELMMKVSDINTKIKEPVQELVKPLLGRYFRKTGNIVNPNQRDEWFTIIDVPQGQWLLIGGFTFDEWLLPVRLMMSDGMPRRGTIGISPENYRDDGLTLPEYIIEVTEDEWFAEQRRRAHAEAERKLKETMNVIDGD